MNERRGRRMIMSKIKQGSVRPSQGEVLASLVMCNTRRLWGFGRSRVLGFRLGFVARHFWPPGRHVPASASG